MSSLLKEAIVDAKALRESALKSAETSIIEKYSDEVKSALDSLLEQEELAPEGGAAPQEEDIVKNVPLSATDGLSEEEGDIPNGMNEEGEDIPVKIDLDALQEAVAALESELNEDDTDELNEESDEEITEDDDIEINEEDIIAEITALLKEDGAVDVSGETAGEESAEETKAAADQDKESGEGGLDEEFDTDSMVDAHGKAHRRYGC